jgi:predicted metal-dependent phosphoesterase TrpH
MPKFDHHLHTTRHSPDSVLEPADLIERARGVGLDGVVITEHDYQWDADELAELARGAGGLVVLSGAEVSAREGHFLVYGLPDLDEAPPGVALEDLVALVRRHDAAIVAAHPFRWDQDFDALVRQLGAAAFDALELVSKNVTAETRRRAERLLGKHPMGVTGSSDGHAADEVGCYFTEFPGPIGSIADFVAALRRRDGRPGYHPGSPFLASGPVA